MTPSPTLSPADLGLPPKFHTWRSGQWAAIEAGAVSEKRFITHAAPTGCHHPEQHVMLFDGRVRMAHQITKGDLLMGPDSTPRQVVNLHTGEEQMYYINPIKGNPFIVNQGHVLSLVHSERGSVTNISVGKYLQQSNNFKHLHKLYKSSLEYSSKQLPLDPYFLGVILGDGSFSHTVAIHKFDPEMERLAHEQAEKFGLKVRVEGTGTGVSYFLSSGIRGSKENPISAILRNLKLWGCRSESKFVPNVYLFGDRQQRLDLLAGLLDTDGHLCSNGYDFISKSRKLSEGVEHLCKSLGLRAHTKSCVKSCQNGFSGTYWRVSVSGNTFEIPCRLPRKKATERLQIKNVLRTGFSIESVGPGEYFGFEVTGDNLYLMDDFTVTHNSGKSAIAVSHAILTGGRSVYVTSTKGLQDQCSTDFLPCGMFDLRGRQNYHHCHRGGTCADGRLYGCKGDEDSYCEYLAKREKFLKSKLTVTNYSCLLSNVIHGEGMGDIDLLILDEAHEAIEELAKALEIRINHGVNSQLYQSLGIPPPYRSPLPNWKYWAGQSIPKIRAQVQTLKGEGGGEVKVLRALDTLLKNVTRLAVVEDTWIVDESSVPAEVLFSPVWPTDYAEKILFRGIKHILLVSATIVPKTLELLGVPENDSLYVSHSNVFPANRCPVYLYGATRIDHKSTDADLIQLISRMDTIIARRLDRKGIIHPTSYDRQQMIAANSQYRDIMLLPRGQGLTTALKTFHDCDPPAILNSPAVTTGYDFPGSQCEYQFLVKVPFIDTRSPIMTARCNADKEYSAYLTAQTLVQTCGRAMRGASDQVENFILDKHANWFFKKRERNYRGKETGGYRHLFPDWFLRQLVYPQGPPIPPKKLVDLAKDRQKVITMPDQQHQQQRRLISHEVDDFLASAMYPGGTNVIDDARFVLWDYGGTMPPDSNCALALTMTPLDGSNENKPHTEYWNVGASKDYEPNEDGGFMYGQHEPSQSSNFFQFMKSLRDNCGMEKGKLSTTNVGVKSLIGSELTFIRIPPPAREFKHTSDLDPATGQPRAQQQNKAKDILVASKARFSWEKGGRSRATASTASPVASQPTHVPQTTSQAPATSPTSSNGDGDPLTSSILAILTENDGALELSQLMPKLTEKLSVVQGLTAGRRITMLKKIKGDGGEVDPNKLAGLGSGWTVDVKEGIIVMV